MRYVIPSFLCALLHSFPAQALQVVTTIRPLHSLASAIMQDTGDEPILLMEGKASPHHFSLKPSQAAALKRADAVFYVSDRLERFMPSITATLPKSVVTVEMAALPDMNLLPAAREDYAIDLPDDLGTANRRGVTSRQASGWKGSSKSDSWMPKGQMSGFKSDGSVVGAGGGRSGFNVKNGRLSGFDTGMRNDARQDNYFADDYDSYSNSYGYNNSHNPQAAIAEYAADPAAYDKAHPLHESEYKPYQAELSVGSKETHDPHLWLDMGNAQLMLAAIAHYLSELNPDMAARYAENLSRALQELDALNQQISQQLQGVTNVPFVVLHDAYRYLENAYGLGPATPLSFAEGVGSSPRQVNLAREQMVESQAGCVFYEPGYDKTLLQRVLAGSRANSRKLDPLGVDIPAGPDQYFLLMQEVAETMATCLNGY